jgi:hypothetical protein
MKLMPTKVNYTAEIDGQQQGVDKQAGNYSLSEAGG